MYEQPKKSAKDFLKKIVNKMKGTNSDMPVIKSPSNEMGGNAWTPEASKLAPKRDAAYADARAKQAANDAKSREYKQPRYQNSETRASWQEGEATDIAMRNANKAHADKVNREADRTPPSADMGRRLKQESNDFYNSDAGKGVDPKKMSQAMNDWKGQGTGKIGNAPDNYVTKPTKSEYMNDPYTAMKYSAFAEKIKSKNYVTKKNGMSDIERAGLAGAAGATGGQIISDAMDLNQAMNRRDAEVKKTQSQQDAHSYWSRKKSGQ